MDIKGDQILQQDFISQQNFISFWDGSNSQEGGN